MRVIYLQPSAMSDASDSKDALRQELRAAVRNLSSRQREEASAKACALLLQQATWKDARSILFFSALSDELNISPLIPQALAAGKTVLLPQFDVIQGVYCACEIRDPKKDLGPGKFGILEPRRECAIAPLNRLDLTLVPGVGFDPLGGRLGRGRGFYDRLLAEVSGIKCGVAFDEQVVPTIPTEPHDIRLNCILTPTRWLVAR